MNSLFYDFLASREELRRFFSWLPADGIERIDDIICEQSKTEKYNGEKYIITGQQPAVFGGPLYTFYKIITAIKLASILQNKFGHSIEPIFWVHSWDHDWEEVCSINFLTYNYEILPFKYLPDTLERGKSLYKLKIDKNYFIEKIQDIFNSIKGSEFSNSWKEFLINSISENDNLADWTVSILKQVFKDESLRYFEPHKIEDFSIFRQVVEVFIESHNVLFEEFQRTTNQLREMGYKPQVHKLPDHAFFFLDEDGYRSKMTVRNDVFYSEISQKEYTKSELKSILKNEPERFSPNLILRCIYQEMYLPCVVYVGGPAEVAYWAQLKDLLSFFNLPMPVIYPRNRFLLLPLKIKKWLEELKIDIKEDLNELKTKLKHDDSLFVSKEQNIEIENAKIKLLDNINLFLGNLSTIFGGSLSENLQVSFLKRVEVETQKLIENCIRIQKQKNEVYQKRVQYIMNTIFPEETEQERFFSAFSFIPEMNYDFVKIIMNHTDIPNIEMGIIEI